MHWSLSNYSKAAPRPRCRHYASFCGTEGDALTFKNGAGQKSGALDLKCHVALQSCVVVKEAAQCSVLRPAFAPVIPATSKGLPSRYLSLSYSPQLRLHLLHLSHLQVFLGRALPRSITIHRTHSIEKIFIRYYAPRTSDYFRSLSSINDIVRNGRW